MRVATGVKVGRKVGREEGDFGAAGMAGCHSERSVCVVESVSFQDGPLAVDNYADGVLDCVFFAASGEDMVTPVVSAAQLDFGGGGGGLKDLAIWSYI